MKKKLMAAAGAAFAVAGSALAEGSTGLPTAALVQPYIENGKTEILTLFTAGAAIVGAFFVWALIKRALRSSK